MMIYSDLLNELKQSPFFPNNKHISYSTAIVSFDIETTSTLTRGGQKIGIPYAFCIGTRRGVLRGRSLAEFADIINSLAESCKCSDKKRFIVWVHNLSFEFQFIRKYFEWKEVFSIQGRKVARALTINGIEFRCSYLMSGLSLAAVAEREKLEVQKATGDLDYSLTRHTETPLTDIEWNYIEKDVMVVVELIKKKRNRGNICDIPMTATGFVRRACREKCFQPKIYKMYVEDIHKSTLGVADYSALKRAFLGGFVHANRNYFGKTLHNVASYDLTSCYPFQMLSRQFPCGACSIEKYNPQKDYSKYCAIYDIDMINVVKKDSANACILSSHKCKTINAVLDNGRIYSADRVICTLTDIDFHYVQQFYEISRINIKRVYCWNKAPLPRAFRKSIIDFYKKKTTLKGIAIRYDEYMTSKGHLNSLYGMCCTDVVRVKSVYSADGWRDEMPDVESTIDKYNKSKGRFTFYAWGVWVTAYARRMLYEAILSLGDNFVYSDTDSVKFIEDDVLHNYFTTINNAVRDKLISVYDEDEINPKDINGVPHLIGSWDYEGTYDVFKTLGAKRYLCEKNGKRELTVSGLNKKNALRYMESVSDNIYEFFTDGMYIPKGCTGKLCHTYIDEPITADITDYLGITSTVTVPSCVHLDDTDYLLGVSPFSEN